MTNRNFVGLLAFLTVWILHPLAQVRLPQLAPIWTAKLDAFSYALRPNPHNIGGKLYIDGKFADIGVIFTASEQVLCYFVTHAEDVQLARRGNLEDSVPFRLQLVVLDAQVGSLQLRKELPARPQFTSVAVNNNRNLLVRSGNTLRLYSSDFDVLKERLIETKELDRWIFKVSPSGSTMLLEHYSPSETYDLILNSASFESLFTFKVRWFPESSISERTLLKASPDTRQILVSKFDGPWQEISTRDLLSCVSNPVLIDDSTVLNACGQRVTLFSVTGEVLMQDTMEKKEHLEPLISVTPNGRYAAVSAMHTKGGFMDYSSVKRSNTRIIVYDTQRRKRILSVPVEPTPLRDYDFAVAPEGDKLVIMIDNVVQAFAIPSQTVSQPTAR